MIVLDFANVANCNYVLHIGNKIYLLAIFLVTTILADKNGTVLSLEWRNSKAPGQEAANLNIEMHWNQLLHK